MVFEHRSSENLWVHMFSTCGKLNIVWCFASECPSIPSGLNLLYLSKYGYLGKDDGTEALVTEENIGQYIKGAVKEFQAFAGVEILQQRIKVLSLLFSIYSWKI